MGIFEAPFINEKQFTKKQSVQYNLISSHWASVLNHEGNFLQEIESFVKTLSATLTELFQSQDLKVFKKDDSSPVSEADYAAQKVIESQLQVWLPNTPILSEEGPEISFSDRQQWSAYWLVDPLDGTREFVSGRSEYSVNIAYVVAGAPVWGLLLMPSLGKFLVGGADMGVMQGQVTDNYQKYTEVTREVACEQAPHSSVLGVACSRHYGRLQVEHFCQSLRAQGQATQVMVNGSAVKFAAMLRGEVAVYPRFTPVCEWDLAAGHALLKGVGGEVYDIDGKPWCYNERPCLNEVRFIAIADPKTQGYFLPIWQAGLNTE